MAGRRIGVDVGGTFTDVTLALDGDLVTAKVPSTEDQSEGVMAGIEKACEEAGIEPDTLSEFSHAMTVSVNALLEDDGAKTALVATEGFGDVLEIGRQDRPSLYDLDAEMHNGRGRIHAPPAALIDNNIGKRSRVDRTYVQRRFSGGVESHEPTSPGGRVVQRPIWSESDPSVQCHSLLDLIINNRTEGL